MTDPSTCPLPDSPLPDDAARALYLAAVGNGGILRAADLAPGDEPVLGRLLDLGLVVPRVEDAAYAAVNPRVVIGRIGSELRSTGGELLARADEAPEQFAELAQAFDVTPRHPECSVEVTYVHGFEQIRLRLAQLDAECSQEMLAAQPGGARPVEGLPDALDRMRRLAERGGTVRGIYEPAAAADPATAAFAAAAAEVGCRYRVLGEPFRRVLIYDRKVAVIPAASDNSRAAFVEDPVVVDFMADAFERDWQRAARVRWARGPEAPEPADSLPDQVGRFLAQGLTQRAIATRLGLSERTVAGHIARLRELYDAETLFQLGWQLRSAADAARRRVP
ncbi:LuxR C-terminal-related transcriptional regulator [Kitasatospora sp. NPDC058478]|uniref:LuxR C-terminal-related transcriptional regulator n=1 Tax=unclassified Kitasatospora TaxID=2633591 RepID=UPI003669F4B1